MAMTEKEALEIVQKHRGRIRADHKCPDWSEEADKDCVFIVTLFQSPNFSRGMEGGGDNLIDATKMALDGLKELDARQSA